MCALLTLDCFHASGRREIARIDFCNKMTVMVASFIRFISTSQKGNYASSSILTSSNKKKNIFTRDKRH